MSENFDMPFCYAFLCEIRRKSDHVLRAEPVGIEIPSDAVKVGDEVRFQLVVETVVRFGIDVVVDQ